MPWGNGITLPGPWGAIDQAEALRLATDAGTGPLHVRVFLAAIGRSNTIGHAPFGPGELAQLLPRADGRPPNRTHLADAIGRAVNAGLLIRGSGSRCLMPSPSLWDRADNNGARTCRWHSASAPPSPSLPLAKADCDTSARAVASAAPIQREPPLTFESDNQPISNERRNR